MTTNEVNAILIRLAGFESTVLTRLDAFAADNARGEGVHADHETRLRTLESANSESRGVWKILTAGGAVGAALVGVAAIVLRTLGV